MAELQLEPLERAETLTDRVYTAIRSAIVDGSLRGGSTVTVPALAARLGVSATPVREALMHLREAGLVSIEPSGIVIAAPSRTALRDAYELREALEGMAARLAAERRTEAERAAIEQHARATLKAARAGDQQAYRESDASFHVAVCEAAHNERLARYVANARDLAWALRDIRALELAFLVEAARVHGRIAESITRQDADATEAAMREHIAHVREQALDLEAREATAHAGGSTDGATAGRAR